MKLDKRVVKFIFALLVLLALGILFLAKFGKLFLIGDELKGLILGFGIFAPLIFIVLLALQVLIAPIPGQAAGLVSGFIFGAFAGTVYSMIGLALGSYLAFVIARKFGRPFVEKVVDKNTLKKFDNISSKEGTLTLFLIYLFPALPDDAVCYIAGLTKIRIRTLVIISFLGRLPGFFVLNLVGSGIASENTLGYWIFFGMMMIVSLVMYLNKNKLEKFIMKVIGKVEGWFSLKQIQV